MSESAVLASECKCTGQGCSPHTPFMLVSADGVECGLNIERNCYLSWWWLRLSVCVVEVTTSTTCSFTCHVSLVGRHCVIVIVSCWMCRWEKKLVSCCSSWCFLRQRHR